MKRVLLTAAILGILSFQTPQPKAKVPEQKKLKVELTLPQWNAVLGVIQRSDASHNEVVKVQETIVSQLEVQVKPVVQDTTKPAKK